MNLSYREELSLYLHILSGSKSCSWRHEWQYHLSQRNWYHSSLVADQDRVSCVFSRIACWNLNIHRFSRLDNMIITCLPFILFLRDKCVCSVYIYIYIYREREREREKEREGEWKRFWRICVDDKNFLGIFFFLLSFFLFFFLFFQVLHYNQCLWWNRIPMNPCPPHFISSLFFLFSKKTSLPSSDFLFSH